MDSPSVQYRMFEGHRNMDFRPGDIKRHHSVLDELSLPITMHVPRSKVCVHVCVCACVRACVRACVCGFLPSEGRFEFFELLFYSRFW